MTTKTYAELNAELTSINAKVEALNMQLAELTNQKEELTVQIQLRQQQVIENYIQQVNQLLETQKEMMEMGIDPTTIDMTMGEEQMSESPIEVEPAVENMVVAADTPVEVGHVATIVEEHKEDTVGVMEDTTNTTSIEDYCNSITMSKEELDDIISSSKKCNPLLTPYYYVWGLRKGEFDLICSTPNYKNTIHKLQTSFMKLTQSPNETMLLGNEKYRDSYPNPDEGRVFSAYGISPTLTRMHSNTIVEIGDPPHIDTAA